MVIVNDSNFESEVLEAEIPVLVDFYADRCGPCRMIAPAVEQISNELAGKLKVCKMDVDSSGETASKYGISSIPHLIIFKDGQPLDRIIGAVPKETIMQKISAVI